MKVGALVYAVLFSSLTVTLAAVTAQAGLDSQNLNRKLNTQHAGWIAKDTPISRLSPPEAKRMMGLAVDTHPDTEFVDPIGFTRANLPSVIDWRNKGGVNWVSPILNQANCGSCVAFASIGVLETMVNIASGLPSSFVKLSPQNLFSCGGGYCDYGWFPSGAAKYLQTKGVPDEACMPYMSGATGQDVACNASCGDSAGRSLKIANYNSPTRSLRNIDSVKEALQKGPVVTTLSVYADFMSYASGVYKHVTGDMMGGHAVSIIGYDDNQQAWIIRNSWGEEWGDHGFAYVSYDDVSGVGDSTWSYQMPSMNGAVSIVSPVDYTFVTKTLPMQLTSTLPNTSSINVSILDSSSGKVALSFACQSNACNQDVDVSHLPDGKYEIYGVAQDHALGQLGKSVRHLFYVANSVPAISVSFKGKDVDLNSDIKDRIEFEVSTTSSSVPLSSLEFHFRGPDGVEHTRTAQIVLSAMTTGWRTNLVPNGSYEIWFVGNSKTNGFSISAQSAHLTVNLKN
jgi:C1A family cysteine protease